MFIKELLAEEMSTARISVAEFSDKSEKDRLNILWMWAKGDSNPLSLKQWKLYVDAHVKMSKDSE